MGSSLNYGHILGTLNMRCRIILRTQKGTTILTATHIAVVPAWAPMGVGIHAEESGDRGLPQHSCWLVVWGLGV